MQEKFCESCGAPMGALDEMYGPGLEADGTPSPDYCNVCYENGQFTNPNITLQEQIESIADIMVKSFGFDPVDAMEQCKQGIPNLKRWKNA